MADNQLMERAEHVLYKTYNRFPVVFDHGKGVMLYDTEGNGFWGRYCGHGPWIRR